MREVDLNVFTRGLRAVRFGQTRVAIIVLGVLVLTGGGAFAQMGLAEMELTSPAGLPAALPMACSVAGADVPDDGGAAILVSWDLQNDQADVRLFEILRYGPGEDPEVVGSALPFERDYMDTEATTGVPYQYVVRAVIDGGSVDSAPSDPATALAQWFAMGRLPTLIMAVLFSAFILYFLHRARSGIELYIRKIPGLDAVDEAVGRATEMGRPVLFVPGIETVSEVGTLAALTILGHVAKRVAEHGTPLDVPCADPIVMATAQEIVKTSYTEAGRIDSYDPSRVAYLTYDQFGYTAGVDGMMVRDRPMAVFLLGTFYAESLIMAETGHSIGAIQIAGTKETSQLPFFVAACDYTLIGEELFAASSYLSREPVMLGSLKGQDLAKLAIVILVLIAFAVGSVGYAIDPGGSSWATRVFEFMRSWFS
ncbi:MAG: DUF6754 domain-containing protein [Candidatus Eisenbacteria bacterium]